MCMVFPVITLAVTRSLLSSCWARNDSWKVGRVDDAKLQGIFSSAVSVIRRRKLRFVVAAELSKLNGLVFGSDSQIVQSYDASQLPWIGPVPGDIAELEAYCRIFRAAEVLHGSLMDTLCDPFTGECSISFKFNDEEKPLLEEKIVSVLGRMVSVLNKGKEDVFSGRSSIMNSFRDEEHSFVSEKLPPLAVFRGEVKKCCEDLHLILASILVPEEDRCLDVWQKFQRLKNICYDSGFSRCDKWPAQALFANWSPVCLSTSKEEIIPSEIAFWKGGQVSEEGLIWLIKNGFKTIVDLRAESIVDKFYETAIADAILSKKIELIKIPVEAKTAPSMEQVEEFTSLVSDSSKWPIYLHSKEGVWRTSAMVSRWRQFMNRSESVLAESSNGKPVIFSENEEKIEPAEESCVNGLEINGADVSGNQSVMKGINPLEVQVPPRNVFSRDEMSRFLKKKISPSLSSNQKKKINHQVPVSIDFDQSSRSDNGAFLNSYEESERTSVSSSPTIEKSSSDEEITSIEGDMCASATGVVRVQSRKKAEMFLVRTDGFTCSREKVTEASMAFTHPSTQQQMLMWKSPPKTVLLLKKLGDDLMEEAKEVASFLHHQEKMNVLVEPDVHDIFARMSGFGFVQTFYSQDTSNLHERVDFVACLGGDGVILHASNLFRNAVPPVVSFNLGSLGFLTSHPFEDFKHDLKQLIHGNRTSEGVYITLRMRLRCEIFRSGIPMPGKIFEVLNEIVVDRGSNPYLSKIECYERDRLITKVQGDGVIVATPTGSTAYSTAAGGSMVHPNVPCMLFTPICPHSLSFRPVILPDSAILELKIPDDARSNAWVSFDGKRRQQLSRGYSVRISMSEHPLPTVNKCDQTGDWFHSLVRCLNWNDRLEQKPL